MYREWPSRVAGAVAWTSVVEPGPARILPDGCTDLIWNEGRFFVAGPDTRAQLFTAEPGSRLAGLRFVSGLGPRVFGTPASELTDERPDLADVWDRATTLRLAGRAAAEPILALEAIAAERLSAADPRDVALTAEVVRLVGAGVPVSGIAGSVGLSVRQLHRRALADFGYGAKTLGRILRLGQALDLVRRGVAPAETAARAGYADQPHLARDVRELAGVPLRTLIPA